MGRSRSERSLNREAILQAAMELADERGLSALSMRSLGHRLGVEAMSLYHHVGSKDQLLDGMVDLVFAEIELPAHGDVWKYAMRRRAISAREALRRHPWALGMLNSRRSPGRATLRHHDAVIGALRRSGFGLAMAVHAFSLMDSYVYGFALQERSMPFKSPDEMETLAGQMLPAVPPDLTNFAQALKDLAPGYRYADEFEFGLDLVLDGLERALM